MNIDVYFFTEERGSVEKTVDSHFLFFLFGSGLSFLLLKSDGIRRRSYRPHVSAFLIQFIGASSEDSFDNGDQFCSQSSF